MKRSIPTLGYFGPRLDAQYQIVLWNGIARTARERGCNLICFPGERIDVREHFEYQSNILYKLANERNVDGLLILTNAIGSFPSIDLIAKFCASYAPVPVVSLGIRIPGIPSVVIDNELGMTELAMHLVNHHAFRRFAFIAGPEENQEVQKRFDSLVTVLNHHNLVLDRNLVKHGDFTSESGFASCEALLGEKKPIDVIVAANDYIAKGALDCLKTHGINVPDDIALVGFDDIGPSGFFNPPLSTVFYPMFDEGRKACELLLDVMEHKEVPDCITLQSSAKIRESCGCFGFNTDIMRMSLRDSNTDRVADAEDTFFKRISDGILTAISHLDLSEPPQIDAEKLPSLIECFQNDIRVNDSNMFINRLNRVLSLSIDEGRRISEWNSIVIALSDGMLRTKLPPEYEARTRRLTEQSLVLIGEKSRRAEGSLRIESDRLSAELREIGNTLITCFDLEKLNEAVIDALQRLSIRSCYLSLYETDDFPFKSRLVLAYENNSRLDTGDKGVLFETRDLVPEGFLPETRNFNFIVEPLYLRDEQLGFVLFEMGAHDTRIYDSLRQQLSGSLKGAFLMKQITGYARRLEQDVAERTSQLTDSNAKLKEEILQRKKADAALKASDKNFSKITEAVPIPLVLVRNGDGQVLYYNKKFQTMFGVNGKTKKTRIRNFFRDPDYIDELFRNVGKKQGPEEIEITAAKGVGTIFSVIVNLQTITYGGEKCVLAGLYDITERKRLEREILEISGREQRRIGQDLHDDLCQTLAGIAVMLSALEKNISKKDAKLGKRTLIISEFINDVIVRTRCIARGLYPAALEENGLSYMLSELASTIRDQYKIACNYASDEKVTVTDISISIQLYRIAQEAINNSIRHGKPSKIEIGLSSDDEEIILSVSDNGKGIKAHSDRSRGMGLRIMNYRANMIGAKLEIGEGTSGGVALTCVLNRKG